MTVKFQECRLPARYWAKVTVATSGCWVWTGATRRKGYGAVGRGTRAQGVTSPHIWMTEVAYGPKPSAGHMSLHSCDNPPCVNPDHLSWGTALENTRQMIDRGRQYRTTHCPAGHEYTPENTYKHGGCKKCARRRSKEQRERNSK